MLYAPHCLYNHILEVVCMCVHFGVDYMCQGRNKRKKAVMFKMVDFPAAVEIINIVQWNEK